jgi:hypothetical protein
VVIHKLSDQRIDHLLLENADIHLLLHLGTTHREYQLKLEKVIRRNVTNTNHVIPDVGPQTVQPTSTINVLIYLDRFVELSVSQETKNNVR